MGKTLGRGFVVEQPELPPGRKIIQENARNIKTLVNALINQSAVPPSQNVEIRLRDVLSTLFPS